jgi:hypothetical protein
MNIKKFAVGILILLASFSLHAQEAKDVVLVVDTGSSMFSYYNEVSSYLTGPFLAENIRMGDTLHIISYGARPRFEIVRRIVDRGDIETVSGRIWLLYPLDPSSDAAGSISYSEQYARGIPGSRPKKVFIVSDDDNAGSLAAAAGGRLKPNGIDVIFIRAGRQMSGAGRRAAANDAVTPVKTPAATGTPPANNKVADPAGTGTQTATKDPPANNNKTADPSGNQTGTKDPVAGGSASGTGDNATGNTDTDGKARNDALTNDGDDTMRGPSDGPADKTGTAGTAGQNDNNTSQTSQSGGFNASSLSNLPLPLILAGLLLLLLIALIIYAATRRLHHSPKEVTSSPMLNLFVEDQNTAIGRRNVHSLKQGSSYTVGGGNSDFLIFLVPLPSRLGVLYYDGNNCTFTPLKSKYFPDIGSTPVQECIGKTIRILSDKHYEVLFHFERYKDPLIALNQLLNSIQVPEPPEPWKTQKS